ncbi:hypothetical protein LPJ61_004458 [Coemansia biformis]|uniref:CUE domain-containing protein n=1 Tax=Coemansia biformis TaxID=1286918 RepID=A0A9W7Y989_9FUNG|nr:hypothetical protein LPJ61_004458 [Coemansia biformis]
MDKTLAEQVAGALDGPSDDSFVSWLVDEAKPLSAAIEHVLLGEDDGSGGGEDGAKPQGPGLPSQETVLRVFEKLAECLADPETHALALGLQSGCVLVGATLFDLACAFSKSHPERLQALLAALCEHASWLAAEIEASSDLLVEQLEQFQDKYAGHVATLEGSFDDAFVDRVADDIEWYQSVTWSWLCLIGSCPPALAALIQDSRFILELAKTSDIATKLLLKLGDGEAHSAAPAKTADCRELIKRLKWQWIGLAYDVLKALFDAAAPRAGAAADSAIDRDANTAVLLDILEATETGDVALTPFDNAPFLLDLEFRFGLREMIRISTAMTGQLDAAQLDYVTMSIDQLVGMTRPLYRDGLESLARRVERAEAGASGVADIADQLAAVSLGDEPADAAAVAQVREMIPGLGEGFVRACLAHYNNSTEAVVNALLEDSLPRALAEMDRAAEAWTPPTASEDEAEPAPADDVLGTRRNVFDGDEFDIFRRNTLDWSRVSQGKTQGSGDAGQPDDDMLHRVMELARRIAEEDEYDDTYDGTAQDGVVDAPDAKESVVADPTLPWEELLARQCEIDPKVLERGSEARKSAARQALRNKTGLSDEQLEGWYIMLQRNPGRQRILDKYAWRGEQPDIQRPESAVSSNDAGDDARGKKPKARYASKEKNKAKVGNHDRKKQHARKNQHPA